METYLQVAEVDRLLKAFTSVVCQDDLRMMGKRDFLAGRYLRFLLLDDQAHNRPSVMTPCGLMYEHIEFLERIVEVDWTGLIGQGSIEWTAHRARFHRRSDFFTRTVLGKNVC